MEFHKNVSVTSDISQLSDEITYHRYLMTRGNMKRFFNDLAIPDYIVMEMASKKSGDDTSSGKLYLREIADKLQISVHQASRIAGKLEERGLVHWSHDGNGSEGTYLTMDEAGTRLLKQQEEGIKEFYTRVIQRFGKEDFVRLLQMMGRLETIMREETGDGDTEGEDADEG